MSLRLEGVIEIPDAAGSAFDHGAFDPTTGRVFVAHTARHLVEVIDHPTRRHLASLPGFPEAAGVVADAGHVLVTNRGAAELAWLDAATLDCVARFATAPRPNGVAIIAARQLAVAACVGDEEHGPELQVIDLAARKRWAIRLPGRPRWCVADAEGEHIFLAVRDPSMILVAGLPDLGDIQHWPLPSAGAHGLDIDHQTQCLYAACDGGALVALSSVTGELRAEWPLAGSPDATFFNPASRLVHVAIETTGLVQTIDPRTGTTTSFPTAEGAPTTALVPPDHLYVFSPHHRGVLDLVEVSPEAAHAGIYKAG
jgi:DNA-binding beta-propeller fold protein YncE